MSDAGLSETKNTVTLSDSAAKRINTLMEQEAHAGLMLRVSVSGGGCSGFQYGFTFDDAINSDDHVFEHAHAKVVIDEISLELLKGAEIDFIEDLMGAYFQINNPNASSSCGCGSSFSI